MLYPAMNSTASNMRIGSSFRLSLRGRFDVSLASRIAMNSGDSSKRRRMNQATNPRGGGEEEQDSPSPVDEYGVSHHVRQANPKNAAAGVGQTGAELDQRNGGSALSGQRVFVHVRRCSNELATGGDPLHRPAHDEQYRCGNPDQGIVRDYPIPSVARAMSVMVITSSFLRPTLSPITPMATPLIGRRR